MSLMPPTPSQPGFQDWRDLEDAFDNIGGGVPAAGALAQAAPYGIIDPDYARVYTQARIIAWQYGFACVMQGSFTRDLDLLLVPWEDRAYAGIVPAIIKQIAAACDLKIHGTTSEPMQATAKPHGRKAYTLHFPGFHDRRWVDLSVMPCEPKGSVEGHAEYASWAASASPSVDSIIQPDSVSGMGNGEGRK